MEYKNIKQAKFIDRPNRFIAHIEIDGKIEVCHVKNTGRCKELLIPGATIFVQEHDNKNRKTKYDLISVYKGDRLINMDSQIPNKVFAEWVRKDNLFNQNVIIKPEVKYGNSRFDFYIEGGDRKAFVEVKGVTLEENGVAVFPDAPTERGVKHLEELCRSLCFPTRQPNAALSTWKSFAVVQTPDMKHMLFLSFKWIESVILRQT